MKFIWPVVLLLGGCAVTPPQIVRIPVPVQVPCPQPALPPKPNLTALTQLTSHDTPQTIISVMVDALKKLAQDDQQLRALLGENDALKNTEAGKNNGSSRP